MVCGMSVVANKAIPEGEAICTPAKNVLVVFDDTQDVNTFSVVTKAELSQEILVGAMAFGGSYRDSKKIAITVTA